MALSSIQEPPDASTIVGTSSPSRHQACSAGLRNDCAINKSNSAGDMNIGDTGVQEYRGSGVQEYQWSGHIIIMNMPGIAVTGQVSKYQVKYNMLSTGVGYHVPNIAWQVAVSGIICQI